MHICRYTYVHMLQVRVSWPKPELVLLWMLLGCGRQHGRKERGTDQEQQWNVGPWCPVVKVLALRLGDVYLTRIL